MGFPSAILVVPGSIPISGGEKQRHGPVMVGVDLGSGQPWTPECDGGFLSIERLRATSPSHRLDLVPVENRGGDTPELGSRHGFLPVAN